MGGDYGSSARKVATFHPLTTRDCTRRQFDHDVPWPQLSSKRKKDRRPRSRSLLECVKSDEAVIVRSDAMMILSVFMPVVAALWFTSADAAGYVESSALALTHLV